MMRTMTIYSIADLHLSNGDKPMDVFGPHWSGHFERICEDWRSRVSARDVVLLPGDLSWAMQLDDAMGHILSLGALPGRKILLKGNHDYWWSGIGRLRKRLPEGMYAIQNDCVMLGGVLFAGSRGWMLPAEETAPEDERIYNRELLRLEFSLGAARRLSQDAPLIGLAHYPPLSASKPDAEPARLFEKYGARHVVYGHLHGASLAHAFRGPKGNVVYHQVSCDGLDFRLHKVDEL
jgi:predicted phosphohydrolase